MGIEGLCDIEIIGDKASERLAVLVLVLANASRSGYVRTATNSLVKSSSPRMHCRIIRGKVSSLPSQHGDINIVPRCYLSQVFRKLVVVVLRHSIEFLLIVECYDRNIASFILAVIQAYDLCHFVFYTCSLVFRNV